MKGRQFMPTRQSYRPRFKWTATRDRVLLRTKGRLYCYGHYNPTGVNCTGPCVWAADCLATAAWVGPSPLKPKPSTRIAKNLFDQPK